MKKKTFPFDFTKIGTENEVYRAQINDPKNTQGSSTRIVQESHSKPRRKYPSNHAETAMHKGDRRIIASREKTG